MILIAINLVSPISESSDNREKMRRLSLPIPLSFLIEELLFSPLEGLEFSSA